MTTRALVLGGGGPVGIAWQAGLVAGLTEGGADLAIADDIIGTSAGAVIGAQLALGIDPATLAERQQAQARRRVDRDIARTDGGANLEPLMRVMAERPRKESELPDWYRKVGRLAQRAKTADEATFLASFGYLTESPWPERPFRCTAVQVEEGRFVVWTPDDGVPLGLAVATSCAVPGAFPPVRVGEHHYVDGGLRSPTNADLAEGHDRVVVVSVMDVGVAESFRSGLEAETTLLERAGAHVAVLKPDARSLDAFGSDLMDGSRRTDAVDAGLRQGRREADHVARLWG